MMTQNKQKPIIALIGRPNVGKSTLFNAITGRKTAIVHDLPGVTRDRNYADVTINDNSCMLVDTGGFAPGKADNLSKLVREQAQIAVDEADVIVFLLDGRDGLQHGDIEIARILQQSEKPVVCVVNKVDNDKIEATITDFYSLGVESLHAISANNKRGVADLLDVITGYIPECDVQDSPLDETVVSILGRPNVGKSSIINKLLGNERLIVSDLAGTTRDSVDSVIRYNNRFIRFIDTAGIRRKSRISFNLEKYCVIQALKSINRSTVCVLVIDASSGVTSQDAKLAEQIYERSKACILAINKWDLVKKKTGTHDDHTREIRSQLPFLDFAPMIFISALTGSRVRKILDLILDLGIVYDRRVSTSDFNRELKKIYMGNPPPRCKSGDTRIYFGTQVKASPPIFKLFTNAPEAIPAHYRRYLERAIREKFQFEGSPVCLQFAKRIYKKGK
jgi:GTP-binding protein